MVINYLLVFLIFYIPLVTYCLYNDFKTQCKHPMDYVMSFLLSGTISLFFLFIVYALVDALGESVFRIFSNVAIIAVISTICFFLAKLLSKKIFTNIDK